jgi:plastocyanin
MPGLFPRRRAVLLLALAPAARIAGAAGAEAAAVTIDNFTFNPAMLTVKPGTRVTWTNRDDIPHTVTSAARPPAFRSHPLDTGDAFEMVFDHPGRFSYFCSLHPHMQGTIVVR